MSTSKSRSDRPVKAQRIQIEDLLPSGAPLSEEEVGMVRGGERCFPVCDAAHDDLVLPAPPTQTTAGGGTK